MARAIWNGAVVAESDRYETVDGNIYFPPDAIKSDYFADSDTTSVCPWKGTAHYYDVVVAGERNADAAWYYPATKEAANNITGHVAFWRGVTVEA